MRFILYLKIWHIPSILLTYVCLQGSTKKDMNGFYPRLPMA